MTKEQVDLILRCCKKNQSVVNEFKRWLKKMEEVRTHVKGV